MARYLLGKIQRSQVLALLRSLYRQSSSGQLEIECDDGSESVFFVSGAIYLSSTSPLVDRIVERSGSKGIGSGLEQPQSNLSPDSESRLLDMTIPEACLAEAFSSWMPRSMRFIDSLSVSVKDLVGPFQTSLLLDHLGTGPSPLPEPPGNTDPSPVDAKSRQRRVERTSGANAPSQAPSESLPAAASDAKRETVTSPSSIIPGPWASQSPALQRAEPTRAPSSPPREATGRPTASVDSTQSELHRPQDEGPDAGTIWLQHFGLRESPFSLTPDPSYFFTGSGHLEAFAGLKLGLIEKRGLIVLVGEVGTGKTTIVYSLLSSLGPETETAYVSNPSLSFDEILESALKDLGAELTGDRRLDRLEALNDFLLQSEESGKSVAIVIDEAQGLSRRGYEQLRLLLNFETFKNKLLQIVLVGQPELALRLARPELRQIADRIAVRCHLRPLKGNEADKYLAHRLEAAGGAIDLFTLPARKLLLRASRGNPRRINVLGHNSMIFAFAKGASRVDRSSVSEAARDIKG